MIGEGLTEKKPVFNIPCLFGSKYFRPFRSRAQERAVGESEDLNLKKHEHPKHRVVSMERKIGKIKKVPLRELWKKEDKGFTKWLEENIEYLNDVLDIDLSVLSREEKVGPFKVDLFAEDNYGNKVIIENQLEKTDHDHLGKVITYLTNLEANTAMWITSNPREEHIKAIEWLNTITPDNISFYLVKVEAIKIEPQPLPAPLFSVVKGPTVESKQLGEERKEYAERHVLRKDFWTKLLEKAKERTRLHSNVSPGIYSWIGTGAGKSGIGYNYVITYKYASCEIYLDRGKEFEDPNVNKIRYDELLKHKDKIEEEFGEPLNWERLDNRRASRISKRFEGSGLKDQDRWDAIQDKMIDAMIRLEKAFRPHIKRIE